MADNPNFAGMTDEELARYKTAINTEIGLRETVTKARVLEVQVQATSMYGAENAPGMREVRVVLSAVAALDRA